MTAKLFSELGLSAEVLKAIDKLGFEQAAPIQARAIPTLMAGGDIVGQSQTGSGKTAAFAIPAIEKVDTRQRGVQVLILCPTRELAIQVSEEIHKLALFKTGLHALPIYGGQSFDRQLAGLKQGANIVIGTPGRVMDHMRRGTLKFDGLKMVILDEVDVMLNMGFRDDIEIILQAVPAERQTVFFSATIPRPIQQLIEKYSRNPQQVRIEHRTLTVPTVEQVYYEVDRNYKVELLTRLIDIHELKLGIIFCNTKRMVDDLVEHLNTQGYSADRLHGDMTQLMRDRVMNRFRKSALEFLVATDVAARGIDVDDVQVVFNYDLPYDVEDYLHRIGRTGRAGRSGRAISFVAGREMFQIHNIERYTKVRIQRGKPPTAGQVEEARAVVFLDKLRATLTSGDFKKQDHLIERLLEEGFSSTDIASALIHQLEGGAAAPVPQKVSREREADREQPGGPSRRDDRSERDRPDGRRDGRFGSRNDSAQQNQWNSKDRPARRDQVPVRPQRAVAPAPRSKQRDGLQASEPTAAKPSATVAPPAAAPVAAGVRHHVSPPARVYGAEPDVTAAEVVPDDVRKGSSHVVTPRPGKVKKSRRTPVEQTRIWMNVGEAMGILPIDVVNAVAGKTGLPGKVVGTIDIRERHLFADVSSEHADSIVEQLHRTELKGHKLKVKLA